MQFLVKANIFPFLRDYSLRIEVNINPLFEEMWNYHCNNCENKGKCSYILCVCLGMEVLWIGSPTYFFFFFNEKDTCKHVHEKWMGVS